MQTDPKKAFEMYGKHPKFSKLMSAFSQVLGQHFEEIGSKIIRIKKCNY